ncbi:MAG: YitT family protein [Limnochordia bacterium]
MRRAKRVAIDYIGVAAGSALVALALDWFLVPNKIAAGGVSGFATVLHYVFGWPVGVVMLAVDAPLFVLSIRYVGLRFGVKTIFGTVVTSVLVDVLAPFLSPLTRDPVLAAIYGGVLAGIGIGVTFRYGGSTGGTDMAARLLHRFTGISVGRSLLIFDGFVILLAGIVFNPELALYAFLSVFVTSKAIDVIQEGSSYAKGAFIISEKAGEIGDRILRELDRGVTALKGKGLYTQSDREVLFVIVSRQEIHALSKLVHSVDPRAFMVITDVSDVLGEGFKMYEAGMQG